LVTLEEYFKYKDFLDSITKTEVLDALAEKKKKRKEERQRHRKLNGLDPPHKINFEMYNNLKLGGADDNW